MQGRGRETDGEGERAGGEAEVLREWESERERGWGERDEKRQQKLFYR